MGRSKKVPLVSGLIGSKARSIHGQLEVSLINYDTVHIAVKRKVYSGLSDVKFSVADSDLQDIIEILNEANKKIETYWLSRISVTKVKAKRGRTQKK